MARLTLELGVLDGETLGLFVGDVDGLDDRWTEARLTLELGDDDAVGALVGGLVGLWRLGALVGGLVGLCPPVGCLVGGLVELDVELDAELDAELDSELDAELDVVFAARGSLDTASVASDERRKSRCLHTNTRTMLTIQSGGREPEQPAAAGLAPSSVLLLPDGLPHATGPPTFSSASSAAVAVDGRRRKEEVGSRSNKGSVTTQRSAFLLVDSLGRGLEDWRSPTEEPQLSPPKTRRKHPASQHQ
ncbi:hypothetical protein THAOC_35289 [Thalassiosira oceanica]|uniref:Uncharacterized protein n=1 Tax=Thalassiosira oceanica TaxID=159749 RepID=K0RAI6_THAOC|nr:hypothetical protein THAOC_35289 [Thalassiosira oceanica]|eukprot:EJK46066.1 hypothetical protein THAOC_35289 [Thalassiosira oceanica]